MIYYPYHNYQTLVIGPHPGNSGGSSHAAPAEQFAGSKAPGKMGEAHSSDWLFMC
jgi:hypothetical protein